MPDPTLRPGSEEEWAALLRQLRTQPPPPLRPFFYGRVRARLAGPRPWVPGWVRRPASLALLGLLLLAVSGDDASLPPAPAAAPYPTGQVLPPPR